jgi:purine nucleosidase
MRALILDTDIGTDVDDLMTLMFLANSAEIDLVAVTTVYGDTLLRSRLARAVASLLGKPDLPVIPGANTALSGEPVRWLGIEGKGVAGLDGIRVDDSRPAWDYLIAAAERFGEALEILAIAPLTNVAQALLNSREFARQVKHLYIMGGAYWSQFSEHNIDCDTEAARIVFESSITTTVIGLDVTLRVMFTEEHLARAQERLPRPLADLLTDQVLRWWGQLGRRYHHLHDPLAALAMVRPDLFIFEEHDIRLIKGPDHRVRTVLAPAGSRSIRVAADVLAHTAEREIVRRMLG